MIWRLELWATHQLSMIRFVGFEFVGPELFVKGLGLDKLHQNELANHSLVNGLQTLREHISDIPLQWNK
jgi:hypothetical protein